MFKPTKILNVILILFVFGCDVSRSQTNIFNYAIVSFQTNIEELTDVKNTTNDFSGNPSLYSSNMVKDDKIVEGTNHVSLGTNGLCKFTIFTDFRPVRFLYAPKELKFLKIRDSKWGDDISLLISVKKVELRTMSIEPTNGFNMLIRNTAIFDSLNQSNNINAAIPLFLSSSLNISTNVP